MILKDVHAFSESKNKVVNHNPCLRWLNNIAKTFSWKFSCKTCFKCFCAYLPVSKVSFNYLKRNVAKMKQRYNLYKDTNRWLVSILNGMNSKKNKLFLQLWIDFGNYPANIYLFKVKNRNTRRRSGICSKLTIKSSERYHWRRFGVFIINFEHISHLFLMFLFLSINK